MEGTVDDVNVVALNVDYDFGFATFTSSSSWAHHNNTTHDDLTAEYANFNFYQNLYGQNPRTDVYALDQLDDKIYAQEFRLASKTGGTFDWIAGFFYKDEKTYIQEHEYYPGYNAFFNACTGSGLYPSTDYGGVNASACGAGEQPPGTVIDGITNPLDQTYIGDIETTFKDMAVFGELTWHLTSDWSVTGGTRLFKQTVSQAQQTGLLFDGAGFVSGNSLERRMEKGAVEDQHGLSTRQIQSRVCDVVAGLPARRRQRAAAGSTRSGAPGDGGHDLSAGKPECGQLLSQSVAPDVSARQGGQLRDRHQRGGARIASAIRRTSTTSNGTTCRRAHRSRRCRCPPRPTWAMPTAAESSSI